MAILKVLLNQKGNIVGTARTDAAGTGKDAPQSATLVARPGQRIIEIDVDDAMASLDPAALHSSVAARYLKPRKKATKRKT
jgi:hypothetical protein